MFKLNMTGREIRLEDDGSGDSLKLLDFQDMYQNATDIPLLYSVDGRVTIMKRFTKLLDELSGIRADSQQEMAGRMMCLSMLFQACMERNQALNVLMDGMDGMKGICWKAIRFFRGDGSLVALEDGSVSLYKEGVFSIALLDGAKFQSGRGGARFASIVRLMRKNGRILLISPDEGLDPAVRAQAGEDGYQRFKTAESWMIRVTDPLLQWACEQEGSLSETEEAVSGLLGLWEQARGALSMMAGRTLSQSGFQEWEEGLLEGIAALDAMEEAIISLYGQLDDLDLKVLCNWLKEAAMDMYLEVRMGREDMPWCQSRLREAFSGFSEAMDGEFSGFLHDGGGMEESGIANGRQIL